MSVSDIESAVFSADDINDTPILGGVKSYITNALKPKSSDEATHVFHRNLIGLKITFLVIVLLAAVYNQYIYRKQDGKTHILKDAKFWIECLVVGLSMSLSTLLLIMTRDKNLIGSSGINWKPIIVKCLSLGVVFFVLNILFELSGLYAPYYESENEELKDPETGKPVSPNKRAKTSFTDAIFTIVVIVIFIVLANMLWSMVVAHDTTTNYNFGLERYKWLTAPVEAILFAAIGAAPLFLIASNRSGKVTTKTAGEFGLFTAKYAIVYLGLQLSGTFSEWFGKQ